MKSKNRIWTHRFANRTEAFSFAKKNNSEVEKCIAKGSNADRYFKYVVHTIGKGFY